MLKIQLTLIGLLFIFQSFAQDSVPTSFKIKEFSLRDYVAPDIKYRSLDAGFSGNLNGDDNFGRHTGRLFLSLNKYQNTVGKQSNLQTQLVASGTSNRQDIQQSRYSNGFISFNHQNQSRYYRGNENFLGLHLNVTDNFRSSNSKIQDTVNQQWIEKTNTLYFQGYLTAGRGRIQPVESARRAMDILISMHQYNRLAKSPSNEMIDSLARVANRVVYKRFFDRRFKRIYQLEELDKAIQGMALVDNPDMVYAANLSDIWSFAYNFNRGSGSRLEYGIIPAIFLVNGDSENINPDYKSKSSDLLYSISGMLAWTKATPISYKWQSDFSLDVSVGYSKEVDLINGYALEEGLTANTNLSWSLGYYPNTRTFLGFTPFVSFVVNTMMANSSDEYNGHLGARLSSYYYVSQRFRVNLDATILVDSNSYPYYSMNRPFWNEVIPTDRQGYRMRDGYSVRINFSYAIF